MAGPCFPSPHPRGDIGRQVSLKTLEMAGRLFTARNDDHPTRRRRINDLKRAARGWVATAEAAEGAFFYMQMNRKIGTAAAARVHTLLV